MLTPFTKLFCERQTNLEDIGVRKKKTKNLTTCVFLCAVSLTVAATELEEFLQVLKSVQHNLTDTQSQQDVELVLQLLAKEDFKNAYTIYSAVSQNMNRANPSSPLTVQAQDLCQEVHTVVILQLFSFFYYLLKLERNVTWEQCEFAAV